ncbi:PaaI family thioesterase [Pseudomonas muyukensis]|uniref:PaaI family thioesterase n=1 Tax=Pseudomonas muyukensis TaxID=2842357 RepID=A0ABX8M697_9PSED|nr:PaaI family thioesterase [Pseudomonas muyukensis]QXH34612.1 PaaI family thioesterase [Pseudomonas muyukensis]
MQANSTGELDLFAELLGVETMHSSFERSACRIHIAEQHRNALGGIHGGLIFSLADMAFAAACNAGSAVYIGLQAEVRYMSKAQGNVLIATATLMGASKKIAHYQVLVTDKRDTQIALFSASAYRLSE